MTKVITVVSAMLDSKYLTLFDEEGNTHKVPQGAKQLQSLIDTVIPAVQAGHSMTVTLEEEQLPNTYADIEKKSNGMVRFFSVAKEKVKSWFTDDLDTPTMEEITAEILLHESRADSSRNNKEATVVALTESGLLAGIEDMHTMTEYANDTGRITSLALLMNRMAKVAHKRRHSAESLVAFMAQCDLPITDDGCLLAYKILCTSPNGNYVDVHTRLVPQRVGTLVQMAEEMVDRDRSRGCSNGLHVARRDYLNSFPGQAITIVKVRPEDVIAVPNFSTSKMRVCAYHIVHVLNEEQHNRVKESGQLDAVDDSIKNLLGNLVAGHHTGVTQKVTITGANGTGIIVEDLTAEGDYVRTQKEVEVSSVPTEKKPSIRNNAPKLDIKEVHKSMNKALTRSEMAAKLFKELGNNPNRQTAIALVDFKKRCKVSWKTLGLPEGTDVLIADAIAGKAVANPTLSRKEQAQALYKEYVTLPVGSVKGRQLGRRLLEIKRASKQGWGRLGLPNLDAKLK